MPTTCTKRKLLLAAFLLLIVGCYLVMDRHIVVRKEVISTTHSPEQQERINRVKKICTDTQFSTLEKGNNLSMGLIYADKYKLAYISIPTAGSTFMKKFFYVLKFGVKNAHKIFNRMRSEVHAISREIGTRLNSSDFDHVITLITARNPYTRLYSAYIDKVFLPLSLSLGKSIIHENYMTKLSKLEENSSLSNVALIRTKMKEFGQQAVCTRDITFQEFLDFAFTEPFGGKAMFDHYCPLSLLLEKSICKLKHILLIKQETFADDIEYVMKIMKVDNDIYKLFYDQLHKDRAESIISSVVETVHRQVRMQKDMGKNSKCWTMPVIAERLWKSFQIQGIIDEKSEFPKLVFSEKGFHDPEYLISVILHEVKSNPLSRNQTEAQRRRALVNAYKSISENTINRIWDKYNIDFQLFGYDYLHPFEK